MKMVHLLVILCSVLCTCVLATDQCTDVTVQWRCMSKPLQQTCCDSLDRALNLTEHEASLCQGQLKMNFTFNSLIQNLSKNVTFTNDKFSQLLFVAPNGTQVHCNRGAAAIKFDGRRNCTECLMKLSMRKVSFLSCGPGIEKVPAALFFSGNCQIDMSDVRVSDSNGSGLVLFDIAGNININHSSFVRNMVKSGYGAGVHVTVISVSKTDYSFIHCLFRSNKAIPVTYEKNHIDTKGGGLYIDYKSNTSQVHVMIENCTFSDNLAYWGGGLLATFDNNASSNILNVISTHFAHNYDHLENSPPEAYAAAAGAGALVSVYSNSTSNSIHIINCTFTGNSASWGGGLEVYSKPGPAENTLNTFNSLTISQCNFTDNLAYSGAAINIYCSSPTSSPQSCNLNPVVSDSTFVSNGNLSLISSTNQITDSTLSISHFPTHLGGTLKFLCNFGSALHIHETSVTLSRGTTLRFDNNAAQNGGAISLYGSWIAVSYNSTLLFSNNRAVDQGGAIYAFMTEEAYLPYSHRCFIRYTTDDEPIKHPIATFNFSNNTASGMPEAIYTTSLLPCVWQSSNKSSLDHDIRQTFCSWKKWNFSSDNCTKEIHTSARNFSTTVQNMTLFPGMLSADLISTVDDFGHNIHNFIVNPNVLQSVNAIVQFINRSLVVYGRVNTRMNILLELEGNRPLFKIISVTLQECPPGFRFDDTSLSCICKFTHQFYCEHTPGSRWIAYLAIGFCMSYSKVEHHGLQVVFGRCPFTARHHSQSSFHLKIHYLRLPLQKKELKSKFCGKLNRKGILCGKCIENYSIDVLSDSFNCHNCSGSLKHWLIFAAIEGLPPLVFFVLVLLMHISFTSGPVNGFIFFSQVLTISLEVIFIESSWLVSSANHPKIISGTIVRLYSIWSLDFLRLVHLLNENYKMCLGPQIKVIHVLALRYLSAIYPLCFLLTAFFVIELHARNCRLLVWLWRPLCFVCARFRQAWKAQTSIVDAFAAFILLSYVKLVRISLLFVIYSKIYVQNSPIVFKSVNYDPTVRYLSSEHAPFAVIGALFLLTFGLMPPLLLTFYQFQFCQKCLTRCKLNRNGLRIFMDAYQGCYKDGKNGGPDRRYFAGLYFIFRFVIFIIFDNTISLYLTYILLLVMFLIFGVITALVQPYKKSFYTYVDICFFHLLAVIMALQAYTLFLYSLEYYSPLFPLGLTITLIMIPQVYIILFILYWLFKRAPKCIKTKVIHFIQVFSKFFTCLSSHLLPDCVRGNITSTTSSEVETDDIPDRLTHSFRYRSLKTPSFVAFDSD